MVMIWFTILGVLLVLGSYLFLRHRAEGARAQSEPIVAKSERPPTERLSTENAKALVDDLVVRGERLVTKPGAVESTLPSSLGPATREFFSKYGMVRTRNGGLELNASEIHPSEYVGGCISIGHSEDWDVIQKPGTDEVFVVEGGGDPGKSFDVCFESVYHLVIDEVQKA
jgi:hypothetical protein